MLIVSCPLLVDVLPDHVEEDTVVSFALVSSKLRVRLIHDVVHERFSLATSLLQRLVR